MTSVEQAQKRTASGIRARLEGPSLRGRVATAPAAQACVGTPPVQTVQPLQMMFLDLWNAYYGTAVPNVVGYPMNLGSNTVIMPPMVEPGDSGVELALTCSGVVLGPENQLPDVSFTPGGDITVTEVTGPTTVTYAVPGNSYPSQNQLLTLTVDIASDAQPRLYGVQVTNYGQAAADAAPALLRHRGESEVTQP